MDHIPLEIHMGLERKGELPDKMHCTPLSTKCWIMGWIFCQILKATGLSYGYFHKPCGSWGSLALRTGLPVEAKAGLPVLSPHRVHECAVIKEKPISGEWKEWGTRGGFWIFISFCFFSVFPFFPLHLFPFTLFIPHVFLFSLSFSFIPLFFLLSYVEEWIKTACFWGKACGRVLGWIIFILSCFFPFRITHCKFYERTEKFERLPP